MLHLPSRLLCLALLSVALPAQAAAVLASIRPLALIAVAVTGDAAQVHQLVPDGASSHDYQLRPSDREALASASLLFWVGPVHEQFLRRPLAASPAVQVRAQDLPGIRLRSLRRLDGSAPEPGTYDAHLWLDPDNAAVMARALADALAATDPAGGARYRRNAAAFAARLSAFAVQQQQRFRALPSRRYIAYHDAWQYLEPVLRLDYRGSLTLSAETRPGARHFLLMSQRVQQEGIGCFLGEPGFDEALARRVFSDRRAHLVAVDELFAGALLSTGGYETGLTQLVNGIYGCLGGS